MNAMYIGVCPSQLFTALHGSTETTVDKGMVKQFHRISKNGYLTSSPRYPHFMSHETPSKIPVPGVELVAPSSTHSLAHIPMPETHSLMHSPRRGRALAVIIQL